MTDKTITGALRRVELLLERQPEVEYADDVRMLCEEVKRQRALLDAAQPAVPEAVAKDWIPHDGGLRPVDPDTKVIGLRRDGEQTITCRASFLHWEWAGFRDEGRQLVGYRILSATDTR